MLRLRYLAAGFAMLAACSDSPTGSSTTTAALDQDIADIAADGTAEDVGIMSSIDGSVPAFGAASFSTGRTPPRLQGCTFADGVYTCVRVRENGLDVDRTVSFLDAQNVAQATYDAATTASIHVVVTVAGSVTRGPMTATISRHRDFVISGLAGTETTRSVTGTGTEEVSRAGHNRRGTERGYALTGASTGVNILFPVHSEASDPWPLSGTLTRTFTITPLTGEQTTRIVVINFDGTSTPTGTVNGDPYTFDLTQRHATRGR